MRLTTSGEPKRHAQIQAVRALIPRFPQQNLREEPLQRSYVLAANLMAKAFLPAGEREEFEASPAEPSFKGEPQRFTIARTADPVCCQELGKL